MNMLKRSLAMLLVLTLLFSFVPFSVFADDGESVETTAVTGAVEQRSGGPGNSDFGHSQGNGKDKHKDPLKETGAPEVTEAPTETTVPETTVPETTVPETTVPETTVPETTVPETTVPETTVPETTVPETTVPETTVPETTVPETEPLIRCMLSDAELNVASTDGVYTGTVEAPDKFLKVFHLDAGRKYFTVDQVKGILDILGEKGYSHMELAIGNDGLRFLLEDMSVGTFTDEQVTAGVKAGNAAYAHAGEWSEDDMEAILAYAKTKGIEIIPLVNTPGHMDAILDAMEYCGISDVAFNDSARTVDLTNEAAVAFTQELVGKYMAYFASKGCNYFNIGADEYANDVSNGWSDLISNNTYYLFVDYINDLVAMACGYGMRPIAFNDGIYYNSNISYGTFDTRLIISYWSSGWGGYNLAPASFLQGKNHLILNTTDMWYYVLGDASSAYSYNYALSRTQRTLVTSVSGAIGAMQCVWCDNPAMPYNENEQTRISTLISTLAANNPTYFTGPNVVEPEEPEETEPTTPSEPTTPVEPAPVVDDVTKVGVTAAEVKSIQVTAVTEDVPVEGAAAVVAFDVTPKTEDGTAYTGEATVSIPVPAEWTKVRGGVLASDHGGEVIGIEGELKDGMFTFTVPHFSTVVAYKVAPTAEGDPTDTVVPSSGTAETYVLDKNGLDDGSQYLIVYNGKALKEDKGSLDVTVSGENATPSDAADDALWKYTVEEGQFSWSSDSYYLSNGSNYMYTTRSGVSGNRTYTLNVTTTKTTVSIYAQSTAGVYRITNSSNNSYVAYTNGAWGAVSSSGNGRDLYFYKYTPGTQTFTVNAALQESRITALTVANDSYTDESWNAYQTALTEAQNKLAEVKGKTYNSEAAANTALNELIAAVNALEAAKNALAKGVAITINYVDENGKPVKTETKTVAENATSVNLISPIYDAENKRYVINNSTLALTSGITEYTVEVTFMPDLSSVADVHLEWWITNLPVNSTDSKVPDNPEHSYNATGEGSNGKTIYYSVITAEDAYGENGMEIKPSVTVPATGSWDHSQNLGYWKSTRLTEGNEQNLDAGRDQTAAGTDFKYIRYYGGMWAVSYDRVSWTTVNDTDQLVAYYLQSQQITPEIDVLFKDWGYQPGEGESVASVALSVAVVYPDGTLSPAESSIYPKTSIIFNHWNGRDIGIVAPVNNSIYNISKITVTDGTRNRTSPTKWAASETINWEKQTIEYTNEEWFDERTIWSAETDNDAPMVNGKTDNVAWPKANTAVLVLIYLEPVQYDNNLIVQWVDDNSSALIHEMQVNVSSENEPKNFYDELKQNSALPAEGVGGYFTLDDAAYVTNSSDVNQTFNKQITTIPTVAAQYKSGLYKYVGADLNKEGTVLTLHYNVDPTKLAPMYVIDFGLPMTFPVTDLVQNPQDMSRVEILQAPNYGTAVLENGNITYTPTSVLHAIDVLPVKVTFKNNSSATVRVGIAPATTVYYEETFLNYTGSWEKINGAPRTQEKEVLGSKVNNYGYDPQYATNTGENAGYAKATADGASASFTFTGTGFELYANSLSGENASGIVTVYSEGKVSKMYMIDTELNSENSAAIEDAENEKSAGVHYGLPIISETDLPHGTYTVQLKRTDDKENIYIDGVRIINTINESGITDNTKSIYYADQEDKPNFYELRDYVLYALNVGNNTSEDYGNLEQMKNQVYAGISSNGEAPANAAVILSNDAEINAQDLLDNGPKNELYLYPGTSLTFKFTTNRVAQLGLKSPTGSVNFTLTVDGKDKSLNSLSTTVDMFYKIIDAPAESATEHTVTIAVPANTTGVLSVTDLKICDDPNAALLPLTLADIENTLVNVYGFSNEETPVEPPVPETPTEPSKPVEPTEPEKPTEPEVEETKPTKPEKPEKPAKPGQNKPGKPAEKQKDAKLKITYVNLLGKKVGSATLTKTGTANQRCTFSASEIIGNAPARRNALWFLPVVSAYGSNVSIIVPVI